MCCLFAYTHPIGHKVLLYLLSPPGQENNDGGIDPETSRISLARVIRGGAWFDDRLNCRSAYRKHAMPTNQRALYYLVGFRVVAIPSEK